MEAKKFLELHGVESAITQAVKALVMEQPNSNVLGRLCELIAARTKPSASDMSDAKLLHVKLKMNYKANPQVSSYADLKAVLGDGGATAPWAALHGLRHKYFIYSPETETCSGVYVFFNQAALDAYMASELFAAQTTYPHVSSVEYMVHDVMAGTECSIENYAWAHTPPTREDVAQAFMLIVHLDVDTDITPEPALRGFMAADGGGYTKGFGLASGPKGLRGKYFTWHADTAVCSGYYTFLDRASLDTYMASDLFKQQAAAPNIKSVSYSVHEVCPGTERSMDLGAWAGK